MDAATLVSKAHKQGVSVGEIAIVEFILSTYASSISPELKMFLQKVLDEGYKEAAENLEKPAEDVALIVSGIMQEVGLTK